MKKLYFFYVGWFLAATFFLGSLFFVFLLAKQIFFESLAKNLIETSGYIQSVDLIDYSAVISKPVISRKKRWLIKIKYTFWVDDTKYESDRLSFSNATLETSDAISLSNYYKGKLTAHEKVDVYYSQLYPSFSVLSKNVEVKPKLILSAGAATFFLFAFIIFKFNRI